MYQWIILVHPSEHMLPCSPYTHPLPPPSPLFPYTTLFRSPAHDQAYRHDPGRKQHLLDKPVEQDPGNRGGAVFALRSEETRLNSSHSSTSYAVFCLIKKNTLI